jgi:hypothetical protein
VFRQSKLAFSGVLMRSVFESVEAAEVDANRAYAIVN